MIQWQADARLLDGADLIGQSAHPFVGQGVITGGTVTDTLASFGTALAVHRAAADPPGGVDRGVRHPRGHGQAAEA